MEYNISNPQAFLKKYFSGTYYFEYKFRNYVWSKYNLLRCFNRYSKTQISDINIEKNGNVELIMRSESNDDFISFNLYFTSISTTAIVDKKLMSQTSYNHKEDIGKTIRVTNIRGVSITVGDILKLFHFMNKEHKKDPDFNGFSEENREKFWSIIEKSLSRDSSSPNPNISLGIFGQKMSVY